ncbi:MAG: hypothetical protein MZV63_60785 [Marinilabiliales bacterium]|nr:hypothetical protein [Marinilabiliales bacterium]
MLSINLCPDGNKRAVPSLHRDSFVAKEYQDRGRMLRRVTQLVPITSGTSPYCRAVMHH